MVNLLNGYYPSGRALRASSRTPPESEPIFNLPPLATTPALSYNPPLMAEAQQHGRLRNRPLSVTLITWGVFILGLANLWRVVALYRQSGLLLELGVSMDPRLRLILALLWALIFILTTISLWRSWAAARFVTPALLIIYATYELILSRVLAQNTATQSGGTASVVFYAVIVLFSVWALNRKASRQYFKNGEHK